MTYGPTIVPVVMFCLCSITNCVHCDELMASITPGVHESPNGKCIARLDVSDQGGFIEMTIVRSDGKTALTRVQDVTGIAWLADSAMVFSVSPVYGTPGIYLFNCHGNRNKPKRLVEAINRDADYPNGADYFELQSVAGDQAMYYYGVDVDKIDFNTFRTERNLRMLRVPLLRKSGAGGN